MSYRVYTTDGIVLKRIPSREADAVVYILTLDFGLIIASAKAVRTMSSKLGRFLGEYSNVSVSVIKSKNGWRITNVSDKGNFYFGYPEHTRTLIARIASVLLQMMPGETPQPDIFKTVQTGFEFLKSLLAEEISRFEIIIMLRILYLLGYVARDDKTEFFVSDTAIWGRDLLEKIEENKKFLITIVNKALHESHL